MSDHPLVHAISSIVDEAPEDIDEVIIVVKGKCRKCQTRDGITVATNIVEFKHFTDVLLDGARYAFVRGFIPLAVPTTDLERVLGLLTPDDDDGATLG